MSYIAPPPYQIAQSQVLIELEKGAGNPPCPSALLAGISELEFGDRMGQLRRLFVRYSWSLLERLYLVIGLGVTIAAPWPIMLFWGNKVREEAFDSFGDLVDPSKFQEARVINFAAFFVPLLIMWLPYSLWVAHGRRQITATLAAFNANDFSKGSFQSMIWRLQSVSSLSRKAILAVHLPNVQFVQPFQPKPAFAPPAYPPYLHQPNASRTNPV